jgi:hypothetical protein
LKFTSYEMLPSMGVNEIRILNQLKSIMKDSDLSGSTIMY